MRALYQYKSKAEDARGILLKEEDTGSALATGHIMLLLCLMIMI
jgi:hypothetical protein